jgi:hypothetical protein
MKVISKIIIGVSVIIVLYACSFTNMFLYNEGKSGTRDTLPVKLDMLIKMGEFSKLIYTRKDLFEATGEDAVSPDEPEFYGLNKMIATQSRVRDDNYAYYVDQLTYPDTTIIVFRGTANMENFLDDINITRTYDRRLEVNLHAGFRKVAATLLRDMEGKYELDHKLILVGHSMGGGVAQIMGMWLDHIHNSSGVKRHDVQVFTFGSPKISTTFLGTKLRHWRIVDKKDPVPFLPPYPYVHSGVVIDVNTLEWSENHKEGSFTDTDSKDHSIKDYLDILYNLSDCDAKCRGSQEIRD